MAGWIRPRRSYIRSSCGLAAWPEEIGAAIALLVGEESWYATGAILRVAGSRT